MVKFLTTLKSLEKKMDVLIYAAAEQLYSKNIHKKALPSEHWNLLANPLKTPTAGTRGTTLNTYTGANHPNIFAAIVLPEKVSRHNSFTRRELLFSALSSVKIGKAANIAIVITLDDLKSHLGVCCAVARYGCYLNRKLYTKDDRPTVHLLVTNTHGDVIKVTEEIEAICAGIAMAFDIVGAPPNELGPDAYAKLLKKTFTGRKNTTITEIKGAELIKHKLCGIHSVGKAATQPPRMIVVDYKPASFQKTVALIGKGLTYDSGGLSLKINGSLTGMKCDLAGSAAVAGAIDALIKQTPHKRIIAVLGIAENAISAEAYKVDDVITMHSGKTVEINNTDAEGRLVLADCLSYVGRKFKPDVMVDIATLTGAQMIATGRNFAGLVVNRDDLEKEMVAIGKTTGDLVFPLPFAPEFFEEELSADIADMKNSAKDRLNAPSSAAAQFLYHHISDLNIPWAHVDMAGQATCAKGIASGYGVALLYSIAMA